MMLPLKTCEAVIQCHYGINYMIICVKNVLNIIINNSFQDIIIINAH